MGSSGFCPSTVVSLVRPPARDTRKEYSDVGQALTQPNRINAASKNDHKKKGDHSDINTSRTDDKNNYDTNSVEKYSNNQR